LIIAWEITSFYRDKVEVLTAISASFFCRSFISSISHNVPSVVMEQIPLVINKLDFARAIRSPLCGSFYSAESIMTYKFKSRHIHSKQGRGE
jgi:hypothetical protein